MNAFSFFSVLVLDLHPRRVKLEVAGGAGWGESFSNGMDVFLLCVSLSLFYWKAPSYKCFFLSFSLSLFHEMFSAGFLADLNLQKVVFFSPCLRTSIIQKPYLYWSRKMPGARRLEFFSFFLAGMGLSARVFCKVIFEIAISIVLLTFLLRPKCAVSS